MNELLNLLPMLPWEGPPLPKFLGITWSSLFQHPQLQQPSSTQSKRLSSPKEFIKNIAPYTPPASTPISEKPPVTQQVIPNLTPALATYDNEEITEIEWNEDGFPKKIVTHRHAIKK